MLPLAASSPSLHAAGDSTGGAGGELDGGRVTGLAPGTRLGPHAVIGLLARGGMAEIYLGLFEAEGKPSRPVVIRERSSGGRGSLLPFAIGVVV